MKEIMGVFKSTPRVGETSVSCQDEKKCEPEGVNELGPWGSFDYVYRDFTVRFLENRAALIH